MDGVKDEWISTGKAAAMLGYERSGFLRKFKALLPWRRFGSGHYRWSQKALMKLLEDGGCKG